MDLKISHKSKKCIGELKISGSKSETNRLLILKALFSDFDIKNIEMRGKKRMVDFFQKK